MLVGMSTNAVSALLHVVVTISLHYVCGLDSDEPMVTLCVVCQAD